MPAKRPRIRKDGLRDNRSRPKFKECPPHEQRYILRAMTKRGIRQIVKRWPEGRRPTIKELERFTERCRPLHWTLGLVSTRPRPKHILSCRWEEDEDSGEWVFQYREAGH